MLSDSQRFLYSAVALRAILRGVGSRNFHDSLTGTFRLACEYRYESSPACIADSSRKMMILEQACDVQILYRYRVVFSDKPIAQFVKEVSALIRYLEMLASQYDSCFVAIRAAQFLLAYLALSNLNLALCFLEQARIVNHLSIAKSGEVLKANVYADAVAGLRQRLWVCLCCEDYKPAVYLPLDRAGLYLAFNLAAETDAARADLAQGQFVANQSETRLRIGERIEAMLAFEARIARSFTCLHAAKERIKRLAQAAQGVLQDLRVNAINVLTNQFDFRQLHGLLVEVDRSTTDHEGIPSLLQSSVVKLAAYI